MRQVEQKPLVEAIRLTKTYRGALFSHNDIQAVREVSLKIAPGETLGIVGESGCGKSTVARLLMGLEKPTSGVVLFQNVRIDCLPERKLRPIRSAFQMVFQDSGSSLNARKQVFDILREPMLYHKTVSAQEAPTRIDELLSMVGLPPETKYRYPHEFSGGQRQRICIARALSLQPKLIILDEPVSALDVSVQAQILNLLRDLQDTLGVAYLFIGHGLGAVHYISHLIAVMYRGRIVEYGDSEELFRHPAHPYTKALLDAAPATDFSQRNAPRVLLTGEASGDADEGGCDFEKRCPFACAACRNRPYELRPVADGSRHLASCRLAAEL